MLKILRTLQADLNPPDDALALGATHTEVFGDSMFRRHVLAEFSQQWLFVARREGETINAHGAIRPLDDL